MPDRTPPLAIVHDVARQRFEAAVAGGVAHVDYRRVGDTLHVVHSEVPPEAEGRGIAAALVRALLADAAANGRTVVPRCSYVRAYMRRHPETHALLAADAQL